MKNQVKTSVSIRLVTGMLLGVSFWLAPQAIATQIMATGFASTGPVNMGYVTVEGYHAAVLNLVSPEDANKEWILEGQIFKCTLIPFRLSSKCDKSGNTTATEYLTCETQADALCTSLSSGVRALTQAGIVNTPGVSDSDSSSCAIPSCSGGGGCPDPPSEHPSEPKIEIPRDVGVGDRPLILAIKGRGAFAVNHLALLYDDGFGDNSTHRLAFATMPPAGIKETRLVYSTHDLPVIFETEYGELETTLVGEPIEGEPLQSFFEIEGAYAVMDLGNGYQIGLVDQLHHEDWYIGLKQYLSRYRHPGGEVGFSSGLGDPVTLTLATLFIWNGETWVTDPLEVLEALSDAFVPSAAELARLRSALGR